MVYLSKGMIYKNTSEWELHISRGKQKFCSDRYTGGGLE